MKKTIWLIVIGLALVGSVGYLVLPRLPQGLFDKIPFVGKSQKSITLTYWCLWEEKEVMQPLIDAYQRLHPNVTINYESRDPQDHFQTVRSRLAAGNAPDIIRVHDSWVPFLAQDLEPIPEGVMDTATFEQSYYPVNQQMLKFNGKYYGLPLMIDGLALVYNKDLFAKAGISGPPQDWETFRQNVRNLTKYDSRNRLVQSGVALGSARNVDYFSDIIGLMFAQNGVSFVDSNGQVKFDKTISVDGRNLGEEALSFYTLFVRDEKSWDPNWENSTLAFARGKVAMIFVPSHRILQILNKSPSFGVGVAPVPQLPDVDVATGEGITWANYWVEVVAKNSANSRAAWEFLSWLGDKDQLVQFYRMASQVRPFGEPYPRLDMAESLRTDQYVYPYLQQGPNYTTWYFNYGTHDGVLNEAVVKQLEKMVESINQGTDIKAALSEAAIQVQQILDSI